MIELKNLEKTYRTSKGSVTAIKDINITINDGEIFGIIGLSGAGKSTLVRCINYLERPTSGQVIIDGKELGSLKTKELLKTRQNIGMVFQGFNLLAQRNVIKNICYPLEIAGMKKADAVKRAESLLELVGLSDKAKAYPSQLSGGQKQRVAIARALAAKTHYLLCDEATSALDPDTTRSVLELLKKINRTLGVTIIVITHEMKVVERICNKVAVLDHGTVAEKGLVKDIFIAPKSAIAKDLILPKGATAHFTPKGELVRIVFDGRKSNEPVISNLSLECRTAVNIMSADTKEIGGRAYGQMLLRLPEDQASVERIFAYLDSHEVQYERISDADIAAEIEGGDTNG